MLTLLRGAVLSGIALLITICCVAAAPTDARFAAFRTDAPAVAADGPASIDDVLGIGSNTAGSSVLTADAAIDLPVDDPPMAEEPELPDVPLYSAALADLPATSSLPPTRIVIADVGIDMAVEPVGVLDDGAMQIPANVAVAGWYRFGSDLASAAGTTVLAAHVDSLEYGLGPFARLTELAAGARITVFDASGAPHDFLLTAARETAKADLPVAEVFDRQGPPRLMLITCGGAFDRQSLTYADNVILTAVPASDDAGAQ
ncbi:class F sortase [Naasia lichenicola]|uniref:Class F sortase n=1 Tax=Naasia lichenicola TaxID=2565933 RepID=A0A4S4FLN9_9MICO|nr:class F sortase [Naasia lichenicola]THG31004.1 class F sortase [Naasia lichenicola]